MRQVAVVVFCWLAFSAFAVEVSKDEAALAVDNWLATDATLGCPLGGAVAGRGQSPF